MASVLRPTADGAPEPAHGDVATGPATEESPVVGRATISIVIPASCECARGATGRGTRLNGNGQRKP